MFKTKFKAVQCLDLNDDYWTIVERKWYSLFWTHTNIYVTHFNDVKDIIEVLKAEQ